MTAAATATGQISQRVLSGRTPARVRGEKSPTRGAIMATPGLVRTVVPTIVGAALSFLATHNIQVDGTTETALSVALTGLLGGAYWLVIDALQARWPRAGLFLGSTARPTYRGRHRKTSTHPATATSDSPEDRL